MRLVRVAAGAVVAISVLAGCSDGETANETLPPSSTAAETSESLTPLGPPDFPVPDEAREKTPEGVTAFARYYLALSDHLLTSLDSQPLRGLSQNCEVCDQLADGYDADKAAGLRYEGGKLEVNSTGTAVVESGSGEVSFFLTQEAVTVYDAAGIMVANKTSDSYDLGGGMSLEWDAVSQGWVVTALTLDRL
jgi:hypothetical protein